jgi:atypical dual specificity phosphatase
VALAELHWVLQNRLAGSARPGLFSPFSQDIADLQAFGVRHLVTLTECPLVLPPGAPDLDYRHFPIEDLGIPTPRAAATLCRDVTAWIEAGEPVLLHCRAGLGRTGTMLACALVDLGWASDEAIRYLRRITPFYIQSLRQERFIAHFEQHLAGERRVE